MFIRGLVIILVCLFSSLGAASDYAPPLVVESGEYTRIFNVRLLPGTADEWLLRGRVTRADKAVKVPPGELFMVVYDHSDKSIYSQAAAYKPGFVHRKTKRASYFTLRIPQHIELQHGWIRLQYRAR